MRTKNRLARLAICAVLSGVATRSLPSLLAAEPPEQSAQDRKNKKAESEHSSTLTGCLDEQDGGYVLLKEGTLSPIASLQAEGFEPEGFAKHLGHKVTVRGSAASGDGKTVFKVRRIDHVSDSCAPGPQQP
jgi:hypothetical protein